MVLRVIFDTNAFDAILASGDADRLAGAIADGRLAVITTPVQEAELRQVPETGRRTALLALLRRLGGTVIDPAAVIAADTTYMARDDLLAGVALACADSLVTGDRRLRARCGEQGLDYAAFRRRMGWSA